MDPQSILDHTNNNSATFVSDTAVMICDASPAVGGASSDKSWPINTLSTKGTAQPTKEPVEYTDKSFARTVAFKTKSVKHTAEDATKSITAAAAG